ncbi:MAG: hypothetical protein CMJ31_09745, partial [Phycisphaerae bacterium]|nr:hypothetical protein [Phycisphaerae bacterium]
AERLTKEATERLDAAEKSLAEIGPAAAGKLDDAESRMSELESRIEAALVRATEAPEGLEERVEKAIKEAREAPEKIAAEFTETTEAFQQRAGEIAERMEAASEACERFETLLERVNKLRKDEAGIETLVSRVSSAECRMNEVMGDLRSLSEQGEEARRILSDALLEAVDHIDRLEEQRSDLVASIAETCRQTELRVPSLADAVDEISRELDALDARKSQVHSGVSAEVTEGLQRVEQAGAWLAQLIKRAEKAAASMEGSED